MKHPQAKDCALAIQHLLAMFGATTVLVPLLTGFSPSVVLFCAGLGILIFHLFTKGMVPVFLGASFAFIGALSAVAGSKGIPRGAGRYHCSRTVVSERFRAIRCHRRRRGYEPHHS